jgi:hypothetical protein
MSLLGEGDLPGARASLRDVAPTLDRAALDAYMANYFDLYWALDSADRSVALSLPPSAFDDDRGAWAIVRSELYWLAGDMPDTHRWADSAITQLTSQLRSAPDDYQRHLLRGLMEALHGDRAAALGEGEHACALARATGDQESNIPYCMLVLARIYVVVGDHPHALAQLDALLARPYFISPAWLAIDPTWAPLRNDPHFARLVAQPAAPPTS